ncbi:30S ribosomal protein S13 [Candidatus Bathyarchaeota archaeon]|jgi:small subunit ribosomal protein S13|nr:30S ribosomal protein S13 [Candidatus Bathyarchaeota archaeon]MCK5631156.1 30S ribosomal protein S13 [Candidatus Bathyarchaeota archaeon]
MSKEFRHITRIAETDLEGSLKVVHAIAKIKGVGPSIANAIVKNSGVNPEARLGFLPEQDLKKIEEIVQNPTDQNIPKWLFNYRKDLETGEDLHRTGSILVLQMKTDIDRMKASKSWRGYRHSYGLKVRGQRTKATGRKGKAIGVRKRRVRAGER